MGTPSTYTLVSFKCAHIKLDTVPLYITFKYQGNVKWFFIWHPRLSKSLAISRAADCGGFCEAPKLPLFLFRYLCLTLHA